MLPAEQGQHNELDDESLGVKSKPQHTTTIRSNVRRKESKASDVNDMIDRGSKSGLTAQEGSGNGRLELQQ